ncbi:hypothetical protein V6N11_018754 [Hibiscus sabdariffa]|uniref:RNase H type-1 domain-containing protein n=2 Tax=Hibiscus sabdariffa TaxID=183260 RepID=A0ABR2QT55_9ROSI
MAFFAIAWAIWIGRNEKVFTGKSIDTSHFFDIILLRLWWWSQAKWPDFKVPISEFMTNPKSWYCKSMVVKVPDSDEWCAPPLGCVKFNTDGTVKGSYGPTGIGGILRDHSGKVIAEFSKAIGLSDPTSAEIIAFSEALTSLRLQNG